MELDDDREALSETYKFLATLFMAEPDAALVEGFQEFFMIEPSTTFYDIESDFESLFFGPLDHLDPYESSYVGEFNSLVDPGKIKERLYNIYLSEGLILDEGMNIQPDHVSAELFFISYLVEASRIESLRSFIKDHAVKWIPHFCDDLYERASSYFYKELAAITKDLILTDYEQLSA